MTATIETASHADTVRLGFLLGSNIPPETVIALIGDLGAGKTTLVKGIASGLLNIDEREVTSPTFTIVQEYPGPTPLYHIDAYRLDSTLDLEAIGFDDYVDGNALIVIEWADKIIGALPPESLRIHIELVDDCRRRIHLQAATPDQAANLKRINLQFSNASG